MQINRTPSFGCNKCFRIKKILKSCGVTEKASDKYLKDALNAQEPLDGTSLTHEIKANKVLTNLSKNPESIIRKLKAPKFNRFA